jgi:Leucine-rich repeat (LRR) protein
MAPKSGKYGCVVSYEEGFQANVDRLLRSAGVVQLEAPRWSRDLPHRAGRVRRLQLSDVPPDSEIEQISAFIDANPQIPLRVYGAMGKRIEDVSFLGQLRGLRVLRLDELYWLQSMDGVQHLDQLERLTIGRSKRRLSLAPLAQLTQLRLLAVQGRSSQLEVVRALPQLRSLAVSGAPSQPLADLLGEMHSLRALRLDGGTAESLPWIGDLVGLELLSIGAMRRLRIVPPVSRLTSLRYLLLATLNQVTQLPALDSCVNLEELHLHGLRALEGLGPLRSAPALTTLAVSATAMKTWEDFRVLERHPTLKCVSIYTGSRRRDAAISERLGYDKVPVRVNSQGLRTALPDDY